MMERRSLAALFLVLPVAALAQGSDPLPSWRDGPRKRALLDFVATVTREGSAGFVPPAERI
ncbi:MAG: haloacid dehalogenase-like hydrolase, partial [Alphaproteobacteria bacterium]